MYRRKEKSHPEFPLIRHRFFWLMSLCHAQVHLSDMLAGIVSGQWDMGL